MKFTWITNNFNFFSSFSILAILFIKSWVLHCLSVAKKTCWNAFCSSKCRISSTYSAPCELSTNTKILIFFIFFNSFSTTKEKNIIQNTNFKQYFPYIVFNAILKHQITYIMLMPRLSSISFLMWLLNSISLISC